MEYQTKDPQTGRVVHLIFSDMDEAETGDGYYWQDFLPENESRVSQSFRSASDAIDSLNHNELVWE